MNNEMCSHPGPCEDNWLKGGCFCANTLIIKVARAIAESYLGRPVEDEYLVGNCTGGHRFLLCAEAALSAAQGMPREATRREGGSGASAPASPVTK